MLLPPVLTMQHTSAEKSKAAKELVLWVSDLIIQLSKAEEQIDASTLGEQLIGIRDGISGLVQEREVWCASQAWANGESITTCWNACCVKHHDSRCTTPAYLSSAVLTTVELCRRWEDSKAALCLQCLFTTNRFLQRLMEAQQELTHDTWLSI